MDAGDWGRADKVLSRFLDDGGLDGLGAEERQSALVMAGWTAINLDQTARARDLYLRALQEGSATPHIVANLALFEFNLGDKGAAAQHTLRFLREWPEQQAFLPRGMLFGLTWAESLPEGERIAYLQGLFDARLDEREPAASRLWVDLGLFHLERGDLASARDVLARVERPLDIVLLRADRRFDEVIDRGSDRVDARQASRRYVARLVRMIEAEQATASIITELGYAMRISADNAKWLELAGKLLEADAREPFLDEDDARPWLLDNLSRAADALGRTDEAVRALRRASALSEHGETNVSHRLNLGNYLCLIGRTDEALAAIRTLGPMSEYGRMVKAGIEHCVALARGDAASASEALAYLSAHSDDGPLAALERLLSAGLVDEAADLFRRYLPSPKHRLEMLQWAQTYLLGPAHPGNVALRSNRAALLARDDIRLAIAEVGRVEAYEIFDGS